MAPDLMNHIEQDKIDPKQKKKQIRMYLLNVRNAGKEKIEHCKRTYGEMGQAILDWVLRNSFLRERHAY